MFCNRAITLHTHCGKTLWCQPKPLPLVRLAVAWTRRAYGRTSPASAASTVTSSTASNVPRKSDPEHVSNTKRSLRPALPTASPRSGPPADVQLKTPQYKEILLIYHAGTPSTAFIGVMRVTTILLFGVACTVVAPAYYHYGDHWWEPGLAVALGAVPLLFVVYTSSSFVAWIHLVLPSFARESAEAALAYSKNLPSTAKLFITTMGFNLQPRRVAMNIADLGPMSSKTRPTNFGVINPHIDVGRWWKPTPLQFFVKNRSGTRKNLQNSVPGVWENVLKRITNQPLRK